MEKGVDVNATTISKANPKYHGLTPLHGAIFIHFGTKSTTEDVVSCDIVKLLVDKGADLLLKDDDGFTPLLKAAYGHRDDGPNLKVLDFLLEKDEYSRMEKIESMELAGAVILVNAGSSKYPKAFDYWRRAYQLRQLEKEESKIPLQHESNGGTVEWDTLEELERVIEDPSEYKTQAFLVLLRILSGKRRSASHSLLRNTLNGGLLFCWTELIRQGAFGKLLDISQATLESLIYFKDGDSWISHWAIYATKHLVEALLNLESDNPALLTVETITKSLVLISKTDRFFYNKDGKALQPISHQYRQIEALLQLVTFLVTPPSTLKEVVGELLTMFLQLPRRDTAGQTLLHYVCSDSRYLKLSTIRFLLNSGADPTAADIDGNAPLHFLACLNYDDNDGLRDLISTAAGLLLQAGAHLDQRNISRMTAAEVWILNRTSNEAEGDAGWKDRLPTWLRDHSAPQLKCLCARVIRSHGIPFSCLPKTLKPFVQLH